MVRYGRGNVVFVCFLMFLLLGSDRLSKIVSGGLFLFLGIKKCFFGRFFDFFFFWSSWRKRNKKKSRRGKREEKDGSK